MADHGKIVIYLRAEDARMLRAKGEEPADWVRQLVKRALQRLREAESK